MPQQVSPTERSAEAIHSPGTDARTTEPHVPADEVLELLGDEYTHRVLRAVMDQPRTGREIVETAGVSKPTVYRRLERLEEAGLVDAEMKLDANGHHCKRFSAAIETIHIGLGADGFDLRMESNFDQSAPHAVSAK